MANPLLKGTSSKPEKMDPAPYIRIMERIDHKVHSASATGCILIVSVSCDRAWRFASICQWHERDLHTA